VSTLPRDSDFIGELCIALAHQWDPERIFVVIYTAYFDESGTHDGSRVTVMGGIMANALQWGRFDVDFRRIKKRYGFNIFHTKKFKNKSGDFKGWPNEKCLALTLSLAEITSEAFANSVAMALDNAEYERDYKLGERPAKVRLDSKYGLCFRNCLYHFAMEILKRRHKSNLPDLHVVLEAGHPNFGDAERVFTEVKAELDAIGAKFLRTITKAAKDECDPLMMADFVAHTTYLMERDGRPRPNGSSGSRQPGEGQSISHLRYEPGGLAKFKQEIVRRATIKHRPWSAT
jgi:hypothetical protein